MRIFVISAVGLLTVASIPAQADELTRTVSYHDLNLHTDAGRTQLDHRIAVAVGDVCDARIAHTAELAASSCIRKLSNEVMPQRNQIIARAGAGMPSQVLAIRN